ncbi:MAG: phosphatase PAP2 family protein [Caldilineaceae bacterium]
MSAQRKLRRARRITVWPLLLLVIFASVLVRSTPLDAANQTPGVEPGAGQWQTWVLQSGSELRPPAPPDKAASKKELAELEALAAQRNAAALSAIAYWDAGSPGYRWTQIAIDQVNKKPINVPRFNRLLALLHVAIYDGMIAAWDAKYAYARPRPSEIDHKFVPMIPNPASPAYPDERAVAAGAAAAILSYIYPDDAHSFADLADAAAHSRVMAGVSFPSDVAAGLDLGRAVAAKVIEHAKADGSDAVWTGTVPAGPGYWVGAKPVEPLMGTWQPWVLARGDQFRAPPPPAYDSAQKLAEIEEIKTYTHTLATDMSAYYWQSNLGTFSFYDWAHRHIFENKLDANPPRAERVYALMSVAKHDAGIACYDSKYAYWAARPSMVDPSIQTLFPSPPHPSYPAAHACNSTATAEILAYLFPNDGAEILAQAADAGNSRVWAGIHFRSDVDAGAEIGRQVAELVIDRANHDGSQAH